VRSMKTLAMSSIVVLLSLPCCLLAWAPSRTATTFSALYNSHPHRADIDVIFGSEQEGSIDDEEEFRSEQEERRRKISLILKEQDLEFKEDRKRRKWGKYANATSRQDIEALEEEQRNEIAQENAKKAALARESGVTLEMLGPKEASMYDEEGNVKITAGSNRNSFFQELDEDLDQEWEAMGAAGTDTSLVNGQLVSRDALQGVRVGSAGGWSLEVFPGDFVVHR
jgi:hypothetical protein